jgi:hypothetical protein
MKVFRRVIVGVGQAFCSVRGAVGWQAGKFKGGVPRAPENLDHRPGSHSEGNVYSVRNQLLAFEEQGIPTFIAGGSGDKETNQRPLQKNLFPELVTTLTPRASPGGFS